MAVGAGEAEALAQPQAEGLALRAGDRVAVLEMKDSMAGAARRVQAGPRAMGAHQLPMLPTGPSQALSASSPAPPTLEALAPGAAPPPPGAAPR